MKIFKKEEFFDILKNVGFSKVIYFENENFRSGLIISIK
jgi:hypothetical protein